MNIEKLTRGIQRRDFAVRCAGRCAHCRRSEDEEEKEKKDEEDRSQGGEEEEEKKDEEDRSLEEEEEEEEKKDEEERSLDEEEKEEEEEKKEEEDRSLDEEEKEEEERGAMIVEGYATTFDSPYQLWRGGGEAVFEVMERGAVEGAEMRDVILQYDHEGRVYARQSNGTLELAVDARGLHVRADLSGTEAGRRLYEEIRGGYTTKMSIAFDIEDSDFEERTEEEVLGFSTGSQDRHYLHTIRKIGRIYDVSAVSLPANEGTAIEAKKFTERRLCAVGAESREKPRAGAGFGELARLAFAIEYEAFRAACQA